MSDWPNDTFLSARNIRCACEASLRRLQTDYIDLYQMHHVDRKTPWDEIWQAMDTLVQQGKVLYVGSSNFAGWHLVQAQEAANRRHFPGLVERAVAVQPDGAHGRARGAPRRARLRHRHPALVARARWPARRRPAQAGPRPVEGSARGRRRREAPRPRSRSTRRSATSWVTSLPTSRSRGCCTSPR